MNEAALINAAIETGLIDAHSLPSLRARARTERLPFLEVALREHRLPLTALNMALATSRKIPYLNPEECFVAAEDLLKLPPSLTQRHLTLPVRFNNQRFLLVGDPDDRAAQDAARRALGVSLPIALAESDSLAAILKQHTGNSGGYTNEIEDPVKLLDRIMKEAWLRYASDIHIEPTYDTWRIRFRADGVLQHWGGMLPKANGEALISRIKVLAGMDITESRIPQDGSMHYEIKDWHNAESDLRIASVPARYGERLTIRLLNQGKLNLSLNQLGMPPVLLEKFKATLAKPHGIVLVTGPTGSGKSTTLYATLRTLDVNRFNIMTVEDPVEQTLNGVTQVQANEKCDFPDAIKSFLRHDPDIIMVGEIRDPDTAKTALKAAMTGHLVLSTLHTNNALAALTRMVDIGCESFLVADTVVAVFAQRLVRRLCKACRTTSQSTQEESQLLGIPLNSPIYRPHGCPQCMGSGYRGRIGLYEGMWVNPEVADAVAAGKTERQLIPLVKDWYRLKEDARTKVLDGTTSVDEVRYYLLGEE
ncbi:GspE/PulE family protein [Chitinibacter sp. S2-10]|uniref:GspE/PulE family protein n=1 Tax=Chitinibacter sp. S2-10 TaxID=3373597 RepID=UPI0039779A71